MHGREKALSAGMALGLMLWACTAAAHGESPAVTAVRPLPKAFAVNGPLGAAPKGVTDLKFNEMFRNPVGPMGLEPSEKLQGLQGKPVRIVGYMVTQDGDSAVPGRLILSPLPVTVGDEDEGLSDDLPGTAVFVHLAPRYAQSKLLNVRGLIQITGALELGVSEEADGRVSSMRLRLDERSSRQLVEGARHSATPRRARAAAPSAARV